MTVSIQLIQIPPSETVPKREFYLNGTTFKIGRDYSADICLPDLSETMSRTHLIVQRTPEGRFTITDTSANGALLNNVPMASKAPQALSDGDIVGFAGYKLLLGIVEADMSAVQDDFRPEQEFVVETDFNANAPLLPDAEIEELPPEPDMGFSGGGMDLDQDLMFDPFAKGPEMREPSIPVKEADAEVPRPPFPETVDVMTLGSRYPNLPALQDAHMRAVVYRENVSEAMEHAVDRFLNELDPNNLQSDYDEFIPLLARRKSRYWTIHRRQFAKRKDSGELKRTFLALFAEEMRKL